MWIILAILFILFMCLYPCVARAVARRRILTHLCADIRRAGGKIRRLCRFPAFARNTAKKSELLVRAGDVQYDVKLWTAWHRDAELWVDEDGRVVETRKTAAPLNPRGARRPRTVRGGRHTVPKDRLRIRTPRSVRQVSILLIEPSYRRILRREGRAVAEVHDGDTLFGRILYTPSTFLALITNENAERTDDARSASNEIK